MSQKSWYVLRIVAGLYLMYLGIQIIRDLLNERPEDMVFKAAIAVVFVIVGAAYTAYSAKNVWKMNREVQAEVENDETEDADENAAEEDENSNLKIADDKKNNLQEEVSVIEVDTDFEDDTDKSELEVIDEEEK